MERGQVWWVNFEPSIGGEIQKKRPAIIVSNNSSNRYLNRLQVVPLTSKTGKLYPSETYIMVNNRQSKAMSDQLTTVSKNRLLGFISDISTIELKALERVIKVQLGL